MLFELDGNTMKEYVFDSSGYVLVDFYATWCKSCESLEHILEDLSDEYYGKLKIYKFNIETDDQIVTNLEIFGLPSLILFKDGKVIKNLEGLFSLKYIKEWLAI